MGKWIETGLVGLKIVERQWHSDERGDFQELYKASEYMNEMSVGTLQDNVSISKKGVIRGMHLQQPPHGQGKLVMVLRGKIWDVAVDVRKDSKTYGQYFSIKLTAANATALWVPEGFAHGFQSIEDDTMVLYKCSGEYNKEAELGFRWDSAGLGLPWEGLEEEYVSPKDKALGDWDNFVSPY